MERSAPPVTRERTLRDPADPRPACDTNSSFLARFRLGFRNIEVVTRRKYRYTLRRRIVRLPYFTGILFQTRRHMSHKGSHEEALLGSPRNTIVRERA